MKSQVKKAVSNAVNKTAQRAKLKDERKTLKDNIIREAKMIAKNQTYTNPKTGEKYGRAHYKKAIGYDIKDWMNTNRKLRKTK